MLTTDFTQVQQNILHALEQVEAGEYFVVPRGLKSEDEFFAWLEMNMIGSGSGG